MSMADQGSVTAPATRLPCPTSSGLPYAAPNVGQAFVPALSRAVWKWRAREVQVDR